MNMIVNNLIYKKSIIEKLNLNFLDIYLVWFIEWNIFIVIVLFWYDLWYILLELLLLILCDFCGLNLNWVWFISNCWGRFVINKFGIRSDMDIILFGWEG